MQGTVTLRNISTSTSGLYQCTSSNAIGKSTCLLNLQVVARKYCLFGSDTTVFTQQVWHCLFSIDGKAVCGRFPLDWHLSRRQINKNKTTFNNEGQGQRQRWPGINPRKELFSGQRRSNRLDSLTRRTGTLRFWACYFLCDDSDSYRLNVTQTQTLRQLSAKSVCQPRHSWSRWRLLWSANLERLTFAYFCSISVSVFDVFFT